jgi:hypothetical protein
MLFLVYFLKGYANEVQFIVVFRNYAAGSMR